MSDKGLGDNWLDRATAEESLYGPSAPAPPRQDVAEQPEPEDGPGSGDASERASTSASGARRTRELPQTTDDEPPPPPARQRELRVQFNHRILSDRDRILQKYKTKHGATMQAIVDQMVDEYLDRRGLLPKPDQE
jgi:hypothetical protein